MIALRYRFSQKFSYEGQVEKRAIFGIPQLIKKGL